MDFYSLLESGHTIRIADNRRNAYAPSKFWIENGKVYTYNHVLGQFEREASFTAEVFNQHVTETLADGFTITIMPN